MSETTNQAPAPAAGGKTNGLAITSLVLGIVGLVLGWLLAPLFLITSIIGLVLGVISLKQIKQKSQNGKGLAIGGIVTSAIATFITLIFSIFVILALFAIGTAVDELDGDLDDSSSIFDAESDEEPIKASIGDEVVDGDLLFRVTELECGDKTLGSGSFASEAQGQYCLLEVEVENIGDEPANLTASEQYLHDSSGRKFEADVTAGSYMADDRLDLFYESINPGNKVTGTIVFDVPADADIEKVELHSTYLSRGAEVTTKQ